MSASSTGPSSAPDRGRAPVGRCAVCWLASSASPCSERCRGLRRTKEALLVDRAAVEADFVAAVSTLAHGTTICPGVLSERIARTRGFALEARDALLCLREVLFDHRAARRLRFLQRGVLVPPGKAQVKGPFRLAR